MDIYVVSNCWWRDGATVIGAAITRGDAEVIADRPDTDEPVSAWDQWTADDEWTADGESKRWRRDALMADGTTHSSLYQEIIRLPLAGWDRGGVIHAGDRVITAHSSRALSEIEEIGRQFGAP